MEFEKAKEVNIMKREREREREIERGKSGCSTGGKGQRPQHAALGFRLVTVTYICIKPEGTIETERNS